MIKFWTIVLLPIALAELISSDINTDSISAIEHALDDAYMRPRYTFNAWKEIRDSHYKDLCESNKLLKERINKFILEFCGIKLDADNTCHDNGKATKQYKIIHAIKSYDRFAIKIWEDDPDTLLKIYQKMRSYYCTKLHGFHITDENVTVSAVSEVVSEELDRCKQEPKTVVGSVMNLMKKGVDYIRYKAISLKPFECVNNSCSSCITVSNPYYQYICIDIFLETKENQLVWRTAIGINNQPKFSISRKFDDIAECVPISIYIGRLCIQAITGKRNSELNIEHKNFCLVVMLENYGVGVKFCVTHTIKEMQLKTEPQLFPSGLDQYHHIVKLNEDGDNAIQLIANEFCY